MHLNLTDDHFDRYKDLDDYGRAKARLFENQQASDYAILNRDDPNVWKLAKSVRCACDWLRAGARRIGSVDLVRRAG